MKIGIISPNDQEIVIGGQLPTLRSIGLSRSIIPSAQTNTYRTFSGFSEPKPTVLTSETFFEAPEFTQVYSKQSRIIVNGVLVTLQFGTLSGLVRDVNETLQHEEDVHISASLTQKKDAFAVTFTNDTGGPLELQDVGVGTALTDCGFVYNYPGNIKPRTVWKGDTRQSEDMAYVFLDSNITTLYADLGINDKEIKVNNPRMLTPPPAAMVWSNTNVNFSILPPTFTLKITINVGTPEKYTYDVTFTSIHSDSDIVSIFNKASTGFGMYALVNDGRIHFRNRTGGAFYIEDKDQNSEAVKYIFEDPTEDLVRPTVWRAYGSWHIHNKPGQFVFAYDSADPGPHELINYWYLNYKSTVDGMGAYLDPVNYPDNSYGYIRHYSRGAYGTVGGDKIDYQTDHFKYGDPTPYSLSNPPDGQVTAMVYSNDFNQQPIQIDHTDDVIVRIKQTSGVPNLSNPDDANAQLPPFYKDIIRGLKQSDPNYHMADTIDRWVVLKEGVHYERENGEIKFKQSSPGNPVVQYNQIEIFVSLGLSRMIVNNDAVTLRSPLLPGARLAITYHKLNNSIYDKPVGTKIFVLTEKAFIKGGLTHTFNEFDDAHSRYKTLANSDTLAATQIRRSNYKYFG